MSTLLGDARVRIRPDTAGFEGEASRGLGSSMKKIGAVAGAGFALAWGAVAVKSIQSALERIDTTANVTAKLNLDQGQAKAAAKVAGEVYADNFGESFADVQDTMAQIVQAGLSSFNDPKNLKAVSEGAETIKQVWGADTYSVIDATRGLLSNGLAPDAKAAMDVVTTALQGPAGAADDLFDTFREYSSQFGKFNLSGAQVAEYLNQAMQNGARNTDIAADAIKEFGIRAIDGSTGTADGFKRIGLSADVMAEKIAKGGPSSQKALFQTFEALQSIKDPVERSIAGVELFGTQWEDTGASLAKIDFGKVAGASMDGVVGATDKAADAVGSTPTAMLASFKRNMENKATEFAASTLTALTPVATNLASWATETAVPAVTDAFANIGGPLVESFRTALDTGDWGPVGKSLGTAISTALNTLGGLAKDLGRILLDAVDGVDWGAVALAIGKQVPVILLGLATGLLNFDFGAIFGFVTDHWLEVLLGALTIAFAPAKILGPIAKILGRIPLVGRFIEWFLVALNGLGSRISGWVGGIIGRFAEGFAAGGPGILGSVARVFDNVITHLYVWGDNAVKWFTGLPGRFTAWIGDFAATAGLNLRIALDGLVAQFARMGGAVLDSLGWLGRQALAPFKFIIDNVLAPLGRFILNDVPNAFRDGVAAVGRFWAGLQNIAKAPVKFVVDTVLNKGLIGGFNAVAKVVPGLKEIQPIALPAGFATGGYTGDGHRLEPAGIVHRGEYVFTKAQTARIGADRLEAIANNGYADGGLVDLGRALEAKGFKISEHPNWPPIGKHATNSDHYSGNAIDVNKNGNNGGTSAYETAQINAVLPWIKSQGFRTRWQVKDHFNHLHVGGRKGITGAIARLGDWAGNAFSSLADMTAPLTNVLGKLSDPVLNGPYGSIVKGVGRKAIDDVVGVVKSKAAGLFSGSGSDASSGDIGEYDGKGGKLSPADARAAGKSMLPTGWSWDALNSLWNKESGWSWSADNPGSSAYGIPQALPGKKMASAGSDWATNALTQIKWGLGYIADRYGTSQTAWAHSQRLNWYAGGTRSARAGLAVVGENGPELVNFGGGESVTTARQTARGVGGNPLVGGNLIIQSSGNTRDDLGEAMFALRRARRGGPSARR